MNDFKFENCNFAGFANHAGLYRVWVPLHDDGKAPLVSVWIDPKMTAFASETHEEPATISSVAEEETAQGIDESPCCVATALSGPHATGYCFQ